MVFRKGKTAQRFLNLNYKVHRRHSSLVLSSTDTIEIYHLDTTHLQSSNQLTAHQAVKHNSTSRNATASYCYHW